MDSEWFKNRHREMGKTQAEAAAMMGRAPTFLTRIYSGQQELRMAEAQMLAKILRTTPGEILRRAGTIMEAEAGSVDEGTGGFREPIPAYEVKPVETDMPSLEPARNSQTVWRIGTNALALLGYREGDFILVDLNEEPRAGDIVVAQLYDWKSGTAHTVIRAFQPPYLLRPGLDAADLRPEVVDNDRVGIKGVVVASWRKREAS